MFNMEEEYNALESCLEDDGYTDIEISEIMTRVRAGESIDDVIDSMSR